MKSKTTINILRHDINTLPSFVYLKLSKMAYITRLFKGIWHLWSLVKRRENNYR